MSDPQTNKLVYFAAEPDPKTVASRALEKVEQFRDHLRESGLAQLWRRSHAAYYRGMEHRGRIRTSGKQAQYHLMSVNHYRNLLSHLQTLTVGQRPNFEAQATNDDKRSLDQCELANGLLNYYLRTKALEKHLKAVVELALVFGEGFLWTYWDPFAGEVYSAGVDGATPTREGDLCYRVYRPHDVVRDFTRDSPDHQDWYVLCDYASRFELAARYPALSEQILALPSRFEQPDYRRLNYDTPRWETDDVAVYRLCHKKTSAVPEGRLVEFLSDDLVLTDGPLPYDPLPLARCAYGDFEHSPFAYTVGFDLLPVCDGIDRLHSTIMTNQSHFGVQNIAAPIGSGVKVTNLAEGLRLIEFDPKYGPPVPLNLLETPAELFGYKGELGTDAEVLSGVNSVARGQPEESLKSGAALALIQSMAIQFSLHLQQSYAATVEETGTNTVKILQTFATTKRVAEIAGKSNRSALQEFTGSDLDSITRVTVDIGNPVLRTTAGKADLAAQFVEMGLVTTPEQLVTVKTTGQLKPIYDAPQSRLQRIRGENERLAEGQPVPVLVTDPHHIDIPEHLSLLDSPEAREDPAITNAVLDHVNQHFVQWAQLDPTMAQVLGIPPLVQPVAALPTEGGAPIGEPGAVKPDPGAETAQGEIATSAQPPGGGPQMPQLPVDPLTGERADPLQQQGPQQ